MFENFEVLIPVSTVLDKWYLPGSLIPQYILFAEWTVIVSTITTKKNSCGSDDGESELQFQRSWDGGFLKCAWKIALRFSPPPAWQPLKACPTCRNDVRHKTTAKNNNLSFSAKPFYKTTGCWNLFQPPSPRQWALPQGIFCRLVFSRCSNALASGKSHGTMADFPTAPSYGMIDGWT